MVIPTTVPLRSTSAPPELPELMAASVWITSVSVAVDRPTSRTFREIHEFAAYALIAFSALHAAAALWHHFALKDGVLQRMLPAR